MQYHSNSIITILQFHKPMATTTIVKVAPVVVIIIVIVDAETKTVVETEGTIVGTTVARSFVVGVVNRTILPVIVDRL